MVTQYLFLMAETGCCPCSYLFFYFIIYLLWMGTHCVTQAGLKLATLLPQPPELLGLEPSFHSDVTRAISRFGPDVTGLPHLPKKGVLWNCYLGLPPCH
jgi:hypothetical protein